MRRSVPPGPVVDDPEDLRRRQYEESLLESAVWTAELGAYEWDVKTDRVRWLNRWCAHYDIDPCEGEHHGERWRTLVHPEDRAQARREFDEHVAGRRERYEAEYRIGTRSGGWRWIRNRAYVIRSPVDATEQRLVGVCVDINERKRIELALGRTQRKLEALAAAAPIWMLLTDAMGVIEFVNRPMLCIAEGSVTGRNIVDLLPDRAEAARVDEFRKALVEGCGAQTHTMILEDGRALATWAQPIIEDGRVVGIASVTADVSERQDRERELLAAVNHEQRRFARDLHDGLGQELAGVALLLRALSNRAGKEAPSLSASLEEVMCHVATAMETTRTVARGASPVACEQGGLAYALQELARRWHETQGARVECRVEASDTREIMPMLADNFYHIAQEALTNAVRHSGAHHIALQLQQSPQRLSLTVTDDGCGLAPAAHRNGGLGLKIMRGRAELVGAQLKIEACRGGGTRLECHYKWRRPSHRQTFAER